MEEKQLPYDGLVGLGTDGAAVMVGKNGGAVKKIVEIQTEKQNDKENGKVKAVGQHCTAHKLNLAASQSGNSFPTIVRFKKTLSKLHDFYSRSALRSKGLETVQKLIFDSLDDGSGSTGEANGTGCGRVQDPSSTRWLALGKCAIGLKKILASVLISLGRESGERGDVVATGLHTLMTRTEFLAVLLLMCNVLPTVNRLSCTFQTEAFDSGQVSKSVDATIRALEVKKEKPSFDAEYQTLVENLKKNNISLNNNDEEAFLRRFDSTVRKPFITKLQENLTDRFQNNDIMAAFATVTETSNYVPEKEEELLRAGAILSEQFGLDNESTQAEIADVAHYVEVMDSNKDQGMVEILMGNSSMVAMFPNLAKICKIYRTIPPHTADCERDFSRMKLIKSELRNRMKEDTLDCLLRIAISGPEPHEFPYIDAVKLWASKKERRYKVRLV